jgi:hypothetical protein
MRVGFEALVVCSDFGEELVVHGEKSSYGYLLLKDMKFKLFEMENWLRLGWKQVSRWLSFGRDKLVILSEK